MMNANHEVISDFLDGAGTKTLDVFRDLQISPGPETTGVKITTRSRVIGQEPSPIPRPAGYPAGEPWPPLYTGSTTATLRVSPGEVVSVPLPPVGRGGADAEPFAARPLSFRSASARFGKRCLTSFRGASRTSGNDRGPPVLADS